MKQKTFFTLLQFLLFVYVEGSALCLAQKQREDPPTLRVGVAAALTGNAAPWGNGELHGVQLALEEYNKSKFDTAPNIELIIEDTAGEAVKTVSAVSKLLHTDDVAFIIGPTWLDSYQGVLPVAERSGALLITPSGAIEVINKDPSQHRLVFSTWFELGAELRALSNAIQKYARVLLVFDQDLYDQEVSQGLSRELKKRGVEVISSEDTRVGEIEFRALLTKARTAHPGVIVFGQTETRSYLALLRQSHELLPGVARYGTHDLFALLGNKNFNSIINGVRYLYPKLSDPSFNLRYQTKFGVSPGVSSSTAYDAAKILFQAFLAGESTPAGVSKYLNEHELDTVTYGKMRFNALRGPSGAEFSEWEFQNGEAIQMP